MTRADYLSKDKLILSNDFFDDAGKAAEDETWSGQFCREHSE